MTSNPGPYDDARLRKLNEQILDALDLDEKPAPQSLRAKRQVSRLLEQLQLGSLVVLDPDHLRSFSAFL